MLPLSHRVNFRSFLMVNQQLSKNDHNQQVTTAKIKKKIKKVYLSIFTNKMADTEQPKVVLSPDSAGDDKDKITFMQPKIAQINQRTLTSNCHSSLNRYRFRIIYGFRLEQKNLTMKYEKSLVKSQSA